MPFPASAASSLIAGYCEDFAAFRAILSQTIEEITKRAIAIDGSRASLEQLEQGMRELADSVRGLLSGEPSCHDAGVDPATADAPPRVPPEPSQPPSPLPPSAGLEPATALKGDNQGVPLLSVFQFLCRMHKNGVVRVRIMEEELCFEFADGFLQHTTSTGCPTNERIGEILVAMGFCTRHQLAPILERAMQGDAPLGDLILESGLVTHGQLLEALERQATLRFRRACKTVLASYEFEEGLCAPTDGRVRITAYELDWQERNTA